MGPLDLTKSPPRSARAELDGIAYLPRAIDKIRAEFPGGSLGEYVVMGTTGATVTGNFYRETGIKHDELVEAVKGAPDDDAVGVWLRSRLDDETIAKWNERYYHSTIGDIKGPLRERMFLAHAGAEALPEATPLADMFDADDVAMFGIRFQLFSKDFDEGGTLPMKQVLNGSGHHGGNQSPHIAWEGAPEETKSFVITMFDPDAPTGSGFWHWVVVDLPASAQELAAGAVSLPSGSRQTRNDLGTREYAGAAPPPGSRHRYVYTIRALSVEKLPVPDDASGALVGFMAGMHSLADATLTARYGVTEKNSGPER